MYRVQSLKEEPELMLGYLGSLVRCAGPCKGTLFPTFIEQEEPTAFPQKRLDPVPAFTAEKEEHFFLERVKMVCPFYKLSKSSDALTEIRIPGLSLYVDNY